MWRDKAGCPQTCSPSPEHQEDDIAQPPCSAVGSRDQWAMGESHGQHFLETSPQSSTGLQSLEQGQQMFSVKTRGQVF